MPEGIGPGSAVLQETVRTLFSDFTWAIVIFDNILILAEDYMQADERFEIFLDKCIEHNVVLKFAKSWIGFDKVSFFGYECTHNKLELSEDRKKAILDILFPEQGNRNKKVRSLLGSGVMFSPFVDHYSDLVANLPDMTKATFNWDETSWKHDYRNQYEDFKQGLQKACALYYPDYVLEWILRTDASDYGIGVVLLQIKYTDGKKIYQPIAFWSKKFSAQALNWPTIEKEGYAIYAGVHRFAYYLIGKSFIIETDHNNLRWMEASEVPKIVRWRIYLQSFDFKIRHIKGSMNTVADALSRWFLLQDLDFELLDYTPGDHSLSCLDAIDWDGFVNPQTLCSVFAPSHDMPTARTRYPQITSETVKPSAPSAPPPEVITNATETFPEQPPNELHTPLELQLTARQIFEEIHHSTPGHWGLRETWKRMNSQFPGHGLPMQAIADWISECSNCQKTRKERSEALIPMVRHLKPPHARSAIGIDALAITPHGPDGHTHILVIVNLFTKFVFLTPSQGCTAVNLANAVWHYWCNFGCTDMIISDRGPDLRSDLFAELVKLVGLFKVEFTDGDIRLLPWSPDLLCEAYYKFCESRPYLYHLTLETRMAKKFKTQLNKQEISVVKPGDIVYLDLRFFGDEWYESLKLPNFDTALYVFEMEYTKWFHKNSKRKISGTLTLLPKCTYCLDGYLVHCWGSVKIFNSSTMILVNKDLLQSYPQIAED